MPHKDPEIYKQWREFFKSNNAAVLQQFMQKPCYDCGKEYPWWVMEWDHVPERGHKKYNISKLKKYVTLDSKRMQEELAKCDLVCGNCHNNRTHMRKCLYVGCSCLFD